jgi:DNA repair exonuclease SbcCD ATPase subunit
MKAPGTVELEELRGSLRSLEERLRSFESGQLPSGWRDEVSAAADALASRVDGLEARLESATDDDREMLRMLAAGVEELRRRVEEPSRRLDELQTQIERVAAAAPRAESVTRIEEGLHALGRELEAAIRDRSLDERLSAIGGQAEAAQTGLAALATQVGELATRMPDIARLDELRSAVAELAAQETRETGDVLAALTARVEGLAAASADIAAVNELREELRVLAEAPRSDPELTARVAELSLRLDHLARDIAETRDDDAVRQLQHAVGELRLRADESSRVQQRLDDLVARIESMPDEPAATISVLHESLSDLQQAMEQSRAELAASLHEKLDTLAAGTARGADLEALRAQLRELEARWAADRGIADGLGALSRRVDGLEQLPPTELSKRIDRVAEDVTALSRQLSELADWPSADLVADLEERARKIAQASPVLESRLEEIWSRLGVDRAELEAKIAELAPDTRLGDAVSSLHAELAELRAQVVGVVDEHASRSELERLGSELDERLARLAEGLAAVSRGEGVEALEALRGVVASVQGEVSALQGRVEHVAAESRGGMDGLAERLAGVSSRSELERVVAEVETRLGALEEGLETAARREELGGLPSLAEAVAVLRNDLSVLASRLEESMRESRSSLDELRSSVEGVSVQAEVERLAGEMLSRVAALEEQLGAAGTKEDLRALSADVATTKAELASLADGIRMRVSDAAVGLAAVRAALDDLQRRVSEEGAARARLAEELGGARRHEAEERTRLAAGIDAVAGDAKSALEAVASRVERVRAEVEQETAARGALATSLRERLDELASLASEIPALRHVTEELREAGESEAASHTELAARLDAVSSTEAAERERLGAHLSSLVDELEQQLQQSLAQEKERAADDHRRLDEAVTGVEAEQRALSARLDAEAERHAALEHVPGSLDELRQARADDREELALATGELAARIEDVAARVAAESAAAVQEIHRELSGLAQGSEEAKRLAQEAERLARERIEALRDELERITSATGWRLARLEQAVAAEDRHELVGRLEALERQLGEHEAREDEHVRMVERSVRKGLKRLSVKIAQEEATFVEAGETLRTSLERLGRAVSATVSEEPEVAKTDMGTAAPVTAYVAFVPTAGGYALVERDGPAPEVGDVVESPEGQGALVVTRVGRSPLPFDRRPCVYLERR